MDLFIKFRKPVIFGLLPLFLCLTLNMGSLAGNKPTDQDAQSTNVRWVVKDEVIIITYDLLEPSENRYSVNVVMRREGDAEFAAVPQTVEGDIGEGFFAGQNREIRWYFRRDYPDGFQGAGYYFEFRIEIVGQDNTILYYALGAAAIAGGIIAFVVGKSQDEPPEPGLPAPPARP